MAINETIYQKGVKGELSLKEINDLPKDYDYLKPMFRDAIKNVKEKYNGRRI